MIMTAVPEQSQIGSGTSTPFLRDSLTGVPCQFARSKLLCALAFTNANVFPI